MHKTWLTSWLFTPLFTGLLCLLGQAAESANDAADHSCRAVTPAEPSTGKSRDGSRLPAAAQPIFYSAHRAMDWLKLANKPDGRFVYGFLPALRMPMEGRQLPQPGRRDVRALSGRALFPG